MTQARDGVCHGMCLNWARKMIIKPGWRPRKRKDYEVRGSVLHKAFQSASKTAVEKGFNELQEAGQRYSAGNDRLQALVAKNEARTITGPEMQEFRALIEQAKVEKAELAELRGSVLERKQKLHHLMNAEGAWTTEYEAFFQQFKHAGQNKFEALDAAFVESTGMTGGDEQERFEGYFAAIATHIHAMKAGQGALLNICKKAGSGHFVAFHRSPDGYEWNFYDPNLGWYRGKTAEEVGQLFQDLFLSVYAKFKYDEANWIAVTAA
jgi:hypothetical protein